MDRQTTFEIPDNAHLPVIFGEHSRNIAHLQQSLGITIADRGNLLTLSGPEDQVRKASKILKSLWQRAEKGHDVGPADIDAALRFMHAPRHDIPMSDETTLIKTRTAYIEAIRACPMVFGLGPAGTGKTYLAVALAVSMFIEGLVERLIFCRPAVEAGERLGFLPGDMKEKVDPYLRPIYDALNDMLPWEILMKKMETGEIEIAPLAFMRGRTLSNAFVILDEAQNTTPSQMKMFLTRMGEGTRMVITGDMTQTDLPPGITSGLRDALNVLHGVDGIRFLEFTRADVVRNPLVSRIVQAYDERT
ncbi:MAG: PhoH family protein [Alphaproteobacteria bacterium]|nr:PhoH family protein [Alphaproteobacteria bacterium]